MSDPTPTSPTAPEARHSSSPLLPPTYGSTLVPLRSPIRIRIRLTTSDPDMDLPPLPPATTVAELKAQITQTAPSLQGKHLRLIYLGRVLTDSTSLSHVVPQTAQFNPEEVTLFQCMPSDAPIATPDPSSQITPATGFDRLRDAGFSDEDVQNLRETFQRIHESSSMGAGGFGDSDEARRLEEEWMDNGANDPNQVDVENILPYHGLLWSVSIGFFIGLPSCLLLDVPLLTRRELAGLILGVVFNMAVGSMRLFN